MNDPIGTIRVKELPDDYTRCIYIKVSTDGYKALYIDTQHDALMEGFVSEKSAGHWPIVWPNPGNA